MNDSLQYIAASSPFAGTLIRVGKTPFAYENSSDLDFALNILPLERLYDAAEKGEQEDPSWGSQDHVVKELLKWFKNDFFTWVNTSPCSKCSTFNVGGERPTPEEQQGGCTVTELHKCKECGNIERFPRYNSIKALLQYRKGRCGEWANCFSFLCRALGCRVRYVWNSEDHVWTEVYSDRQQRWIHCDSCEAAWDNPTLYGNGWGKKMAYVIGFSIEGARDVTKRYVRTKQKALPRDKIDEDTLSTVLALFSMQCRETMSERQQELLMDEDQIEHAELESYVEDPTPTDKIQAPRQSGQGQWTKERGEDGNI